MVNNTDGSSISSKSVSDGKTTDINAGNANDPRSDENGHANSVTKNRGNLRDRLRGRRRRTQSTTGAVETDDNVGQTVQLGEINAPEPVDFKSSFSKKPTKKEYESLLETAIGTVFELPAVVGHSHWTLSETEKGLLASCVSIYIDSLPKTSQKKINESLAKTVPLLALLGVLIVVISPRLKTSMEMIREKNIE